MLNLVICDNEPAIIEELEEYLDKISDMSFDYEVFFSAEELYSYKKKQDLDFDVYILDIEMGEMSGLELAKKLRQDSLHSLIIFLTSFSKYVYDVFEVVTFDFILKPVSFENFSKVLHKACDFLCMAKVNFVFSYRKNSYSIPCQSIVYIEKLGRKALIHTNTGDIYQCNKNLDEIWSQLDKRMFASIRVACIVNLSEIVQVVRDELLLKNGNTLHVGRAYRQEIKLRHLQFLKEQL